MQEFQEKLSDNAAASMHRAGGGIKAQIYNDINVCNQGVKCDDMVRRRVNYYSR